MGGPPRVHNEARIKLRGNPGGRRLARRPPRLGVAGGPYAPYSTNVTNSAAAVWAEITRPLVEGGQLEETDQIAVEVFAETYAAWRRAVTDDEAESTAITQRVRKQATDQLIELLKEFGATPLSRRRMGIATVYKEDQLGAFLRRDTG